MATAQLYWQRHFSQFLPNPASVPYRAAAVRADWRLVRINKHLTIIWRNSVLAHAMDFLFNVAQQSLRHNGAKGGGGPNRLRLHFAQISTMLRN